MYSGLFWLLCVYSPGGNIHLISGTGSSNAIRKTTAKNHCKYNMANEEGFDIGRDLPVFLASVLDKTEYFCQNDEGEGVAEAHAEVIDQSIRMLTSIRDCRDIGTSDKEELESLAEAFAHVLSSLNHHIAIKPVTPETVAEYRFASKKEEKETPG